VYCRESFEQNSILEEEGDITNKLWWVFEFLNDELICNESRRAEDRPILSQS